MSMLQMAKTVFRNLLTNPATQMYPFKKKAFYKNTRGKVGIKIEDCIFCGMCSRKCPTGALEVTRDKKEWTITRTKCISCSFCVEVCPKKCLWLENQYNPAVAVKEKEAHTLNA